MRQLAVTPATKRKAAALIGVLFLVALLFDVLATFLLDPVVDVSSYLENAYPDRVAVIGGTVLRLIAAFAIIFIPIVLLSAVGAHGQGLAVGYVVFRALEGILFVYIAVQTLSFTSISESYLENSDQGASALRDIGGMIHAEIHWANAVYILTFVLGALLFYSLLYREVLVPKFLAIWGLLGTIVLFVGLVLGVFGLGVFSSETLLDGMAYFAPLIALNELVLAIWLISKGFRDQPSPA